ncbi:hypothetical protein LLB_2635 [Legionella longbeachae D-4968]|nr:hypothetical protein LLB_2635 [Legionella longbeachae D-4968]
MVLSGLVEVIPNDTNAYKIKSLGFFFTQAITPKIIGKLNRLSVC